MSKLHDEVAKLGGSASERYKKEGDNPMQVHKEPAEGVGPLDIIIEGIHKAANDVSDICLILGTLRSAPKKLPKPHEPEDSGKLAKLDIALRDLNNEIHYLSDIVSKIV